MTDPAQRGIRLGRLLWRPLVHSVSSAVPALAETIGDDADGTSLHLAIDPTATWSDGAPVLATDIAAEAAACGVEATVVAERQVRFHGVDAVRCAQRLVPVRRRDGRLDLTVGTGPYVVESLGADRAILARRGGPDAPALLDVRAEPDLEWSLAALRGGGIDVILEADEAVVADVIATPGPAVLALPDSARVVQLLVFRSGLGVDACGHLTEVIDRPGLIAEVYHGLARPGSAALVEAAGPGGGAHLDEAPATILVNGENRLRRRAAERIVADWMAAGIPASVEVEPWDGVMDRLRQGTYDCFLVSIRDVPGAASGAATGGGVLPSTAGWSTEVSTHASWVALGSTALRHVPLLVALNGGGVRC